MKAKRAPRKGSPVGREWINAKRSYVKTTCNDREGCGKPISRYVPMALPSDCAWSRSGLPSGLAGSETDLVIANAQRGMLAQLSARLRARQVAAGEGGDDEAGDDGVPILVDDSCSVGLWVLGAYTKCG